MLELYTALFHDPGPAIAKYLDLLRRALIHEFLVAELVLAIVLVASTTIAALQLHVARTGTAAAAGRYQCWGRDQGVEKCPMVLVTGYQIYRFAPDGTATVLPRVNIGLDSSASDAPIGVPGPESLGSPVPVHDPR